MFPPFPAPDAPEDPNMLDFGQDMNEDVLEMDPDADSGSGNEPAPETTEESAPQG
jgi:hypothetical protein